MSTMLGEFNAMNIKPATMGGSILPVSDNLGHLVVIYDDETLPASKDRNNGVLNLKLKIVEGPYNGTEGVYRINYFFMGTDANSLTTKRIADAQLSAICHAVNVYNPKAVAELYNKPFRIVVEMQKGEEAVEKGYTQIKGVLCADGGIPGFPDKPKVQRQATTQAAPATPAPAPATPAATPGWGAPPAPPAPTPEAAPTTPAAPWGAPPAGGAAPASPPWAAKP